MAFNLTARDAISEWAGTQIDDVSVHTADPGATGTNEVTGGGYARQTPAWNAAGGDGTIDLTTTLSFSGPASGGATHYGLWVGATFWGGFALTGDAAFNAAGEYDITEITVPVTSS